MQFYALLTNKNQQINKYFNQKYSIEHILPPKCKILKLKNWLKSRIQELDLDLGSVSVQRVIDCSLSKGLSKTPLCQCWKGPELDQSQNLIDSSMAQASSTHKVSWKSVHDFLSNLVHRQKTDKQTNIESENINSFGRANELKYGRTNCIAPYETTILHYIMKYKRHITIAPFVEVATVDT